MRVSHENDRSSERGSVVVALMALMLMMLIGTALIARSQVDLAAVGADADAISAEAAAEQGVAEVLARLEGGETGSFSVEGEVANGKFAAKVEQLSETEYFVRAEARVGDRTRAVEVTISGELTAPYALFIEEKSSITDTRGVISGRVGTNGGLEGSGVESMRDVDLYGPVASCRDCASTNLFENVLELAEPTVLTRTTQKCPEDGIFAGAIDGRGGVPFVCSADEMKAATVAFTDTVTIANPPVIVHVRIGLDVTISDASINAGGEPDDFQLYAEGDGTFYWKLDIFNSKIYGFVYSPGRYSYAQSMSLVGSLITGVLVVDAPGDVWIDPPDSATTSTASDWTVTAWERVPAS